MASILFDDPRVDSGDEGLEIWLVGFVFGFFELFEEEIVVGWLCWVCVEDSHWFWELWVGHLGVHGDEEAVGFVVDEEVGFGDSVFADGDDFWMAAVEADAFGFVFAEDEWFAVFDFDGVLGRGVFLGGVEPCFVVEDVAVLVDVYEGGAFVCHCSFEDMVHAFHVDIE